MFDPTKSVWKAVKAGGIFAIAEFLVKIAPVAIPQVWALPIGGALVGILNWWKHREGR